MRIEPAERYKHRPDLSPEEHRIIIQKRVDSITRIVAIVVAFLSTFALFVKILFF